MDALQISLTPHARREIIVGGELSAARQIKYMIFEADYSTIAGYTKFYVPGKYRAAVPAIPTPGSGDLFLSHIASDSLWWTGMSLVNTTSSEKTVTLMFDTGETRAVTIGALSHSSLLLESLFGNKPQPEIHSAVLKNAGGITGLELFGSNTQLAGIPLTSETSTTVYYPHIAADSLWWTGILAYNPFDLPGDLTITPYNADGKMLTILNRSLAGKARYIGTTTTLGLPADAAWLLIEAVRPIFGFELFGSQASNSLAGFSGTNLRAKNGIFAKRERSGWTGIALVNLEIDPATVALTGYDDSGSIIATQTISLGAHARTAKYAQEFFLLDISRATYFTFTSDRYLAGFQLNGSADGTMLDALPMR